MKLFRSTLLFVAILIQIGCAAHKINLSDSASSYKKHDGLVVTEEVPNVPHCGPELLTVLSVGVIPSGCSRKVFATSDVSLETKEIGSINYLQGWATVFLVPFTSWEYQNISSLEDTIVHKINTE